MSLPTAAILVIGDEILSGKTEEQNARFLIGELRELGVSLRRILTIPDQVDEVAAAARELAAGVDYLFTSGGVGPTHDDVTITGIARAFGRPVVRHPELEAKIRAYFGDGADESRLREFYQGQVNEARLKLADFPEGAELIMDARLGFPTIKCENFYILPGIPEILEQKFDALRDRFTAAPYFLRVVYTSDGEGTIAEHLNATLVAFPDLMLGSYPKIGDPEYAVKLTLESKDRDYVERALAHLLKLLGTDAVVRTE